MESFATGLKRIQNACDEAGCRVEYKMTEYGFIVRFYRHSGSAWGTYSSDSNSSYPLTDSLKEPINDIGFGTQKEVADTLGKINKRRKLTTEENLDVYGPQILQMISNDNKVSRRKMALELSISERTIQRVLNSMPSLHFCRWWKKRPLGIDRKGVSKSCLYL